MFGLLLLLAVGEAALGSTCNLQGGKCVRNCVDGEWSPELECETGGLCCIPSALTTETPLNLDNFALPGQENCGVSLTHKIVGGAVANQHEWPWQISLWSTAYNMHICGGSLITDQWVVTAAHCVVGTNTNLPAHFRVILGEHDLSVRSGNEVTRNVLQIIKHELYRDRSPWPNDIALLKLSEPVTIGTRFINTVCLPNATEVFYSGDDCWCTGWGDTKNTGNDNLLNEIYADIRTNAECAAAWGSKNILTTHICESDGSQGTCQGDSGGPLQCRKLGRYRLAGVTSWGVSDCMTAGYPSVYTRISSYISWITQKIGADAANRKPSRYD